MRKPAKIICAAAVLIIALLAGALSARHYLNSEARHSAAKRYQSELSFAAQRLEDYAENGEDYNFTTAQSHIYCAYTLAPTSGHGAALYDLWNAMIFDGGAVKEHLPGIRGYIGKLRENPEDAQTAEALRDAVHTLRGE
jgi:hypothetical protein